MLLELTVYWFADDYDPDLEENIGRKPKTKLGIMIVNTDHIVAFNPHDSGQTMIRLSNGDIFQSTYNFEKFRTLMEGMQVTKDILVSGDN
jgi:hypothetical protein